MASLLPEQAVLPEQASLPEQAVLPEQASLPEQAAVGHPIQQPLRPFRISPLVSIPHAEPMPDMAIDMQFRRYAQFFVFQVEPGHPRRNIVPVLVAAKNKDG